MKSIHAVIAIMALLSVTTNAFVVQTSQRRGSHAALKMIPVDMPIVDHQPPAVFAQQASSIPPVIMRSSLDSAVSTWISKSDYIDLGEKKTKIRNKELERKKFNFNVWFWGGGIIAPFIATVFYFGFRFWER
mmetsp:Transcript_425/g.976  ORF Transcript_425/g.976 Transcript_425/m.976 type:complete len:132 (+) Transcript_425:213-608(+)